MQRSAGPWLGPLVLLFGACAGPANPGLSSPEARLPGQPEPAREVGPPAQATGDCGLDPAIIPDFTLVDENPSSATYGTTYSRDAFLGQVFVVYWAVAT